jgi:peptidoglycan/xylan/chitin deacetylase (PgdA/CDA1 family)
MDTRRTQKKSTLVFRLDDFRAASDPISQVEFQIIQMFIERGLPIVVSVIPKGLEMYPDKVSFLKGYLTSGQVEIAQHGYDHTLYRKLYMSSGATSEFEGRSYANQFERIASGKQLLEELFQRKIQSFVPPYNSYDVETIKACSEVGFRVISAGISGSVNKKDISLKILPATVALRTLDVLVKSWKINNKYDGLAVVYFHAYEFVDSGDHRAYVTLEELGYVLDEILRSENIEVLDLIQAVEKFGAGLTKQRFLMAQRTIKYARKIYRSKILTKIGNYLRVPGNLDIIGYETTRNYRLLLFKMHILLYLPIISFILIVFLLFISMKGNNEDKTQLNFNKKLNRKLL